MTTEQRSRPARAPRASAPIPAYAWRAVGPVALVAGLFVLVRAPRYPYFGDELYFLAAGRRPAITYLDQGPFVPLLARLCDTLAPDSPLALRLPAVLAGVAAILVTAALAREFGGGGRAQAVAALAYATSPFFVSQTASLSTFAFDATCAATVVWLIVRWTRAREDRLLWFAALVLMLELQIKWSAPPLLCGLALGVVVFGPRELPRTPALWAWTGAVLLTALPGLTWQARRGWPQWAMGPVISAEQRAATGGGFGLAVQIPVLAGLLGTLLALWGCWVLVRANHFRPYRFLLVALVAQVVFVFATTTRPYFVANLFPALFAAGAVAAVAATSGRLRTLGVSVVALASAAIAVTTVLILPRPLSELHTPSADRAALYGRLRTYGTTGWDRLVETVDAAHRGLAEADRPRTAILADTYWQAAALDHLARPDWPEVYSPNRGFAEFGPPPDHAEVLLYVAPRRMEPTLGRFFGEVTAVGVLDDPLGFPGIDRDVVVFRCERLLRPWPTTWPELIRYELDAD
ncbi:ArnT family glycosyltransferase [Nocardia takedensis]|uniref:ArnT family glycosyltransferase n=1 Tax=Nocardia takedensis TaxID=259390 RepID=UPI00059279E5|nr:glycosyltransferase family 39 protein [Nocardia takedensis]